MEIRKAIKCKHIFFSRELKNGMGYLNIVICDDVQVYAESLERKIYDIFKEMDIKGGVDKFTELDQFKKNQSNYDVIFLSIDIFENNVLQNIYDLKRKYVYGKMILISEDTSYIQDAYKVQPFRYLLKSDRQEKIKEAICSAIAENEEKAGIVLEGNEGFYSVLLKDILYAEALGDEVVIVTVNSEMFIVRISLKKFFCMAEEEFIKCSRSIIVNSRYIKEIRDREIILKNEFSIMISYREKRKVKERYLSYVFKNMKKRTTL